MAPNPTTPNPNNPPAIAPPGPKVAPIAALYNTTYVTVPIPKAVVVPAIN